MTFNPDEPRLPNGRWTKAGAVVHALIHASDLSTPDARRSPEVSPEEFQQHAKRGAAKIAALDAKMSPPKALVGNQWDMIQSRAWHETRKPWGGITVDAHTGEHVSPTADAYALTTRPPGVKSVHVSPSASREDFEKAMKTARKRFAKVLSRPGSHLGVFRDEDTGTIDIDPVLVTPRLNDVHDIGAYTHAVGGAYHFKSGDGYWPPHVADKEKNMSTIYTPTVHEGGFDLSSRDGKLAFWKQILPMKSIHYTAKDGSRQKIDFTKEYLTDLANNKAVDKLGFLLANTDNAHTMDPERWRGEVEALEVRDDGLYGKIVFPNADAAKAVLDNPNLGVSARIREGVARSDGSTLNRGLIHVLGTLDPQVSGMGPWQATDLSTDEGDVLDLSDKEYETMAEKKTETEKKALADFTEEDIEKMSDEELDTFLETYAAELDEYDESDDDPENISRGENETKTKDDEKVLVGAGADMSKKTGDEANEIELANQSAASANARATEALRRLAEAEWKSARDGYMAEGVPPHALDLAAEVLNRPDDMVIDLSNSGDADVNVSEVVRGLLDALKGTVDLSNEEGHMSVRTASDEDPDSDVLALWGDLS